jgi:hypothetical protein
LKEADENRALLKTANFLRSRRLHFEDDIGLAQSVRVNKGSLLLVLGIRKARCNSCVVFDQDLETCFLQFRCKVGRQSDAPLAW